MLKIMVNGCNGKMGQVVCQLIQKDNELNLMCGFDKMVMPNAEIPIYVKIEDIQEAPDVIIDFSVPNATLNILKYASRNKIPVVIATTGFSEEEEMMIQAYSKQIPIFKSANMSYDIMIMKKLVKWLAPLLKETDIEITETHHNQKIDSPSGTAQMLANEINSALDGSHYCEYDRHKKREKRNKNEIGMHSIRGGNIVGEHTVQFFGEFETFELKHTTYSRDVFAEGAIKAAKFIVTKAQGMYKMEDLLPFRMEK